MVEKREKQNTHQHVSKNQENASEKKRAKSGVLYEATMTGITVKLGLWTSPEVFHY